MRALKETGDTMCKKIFTEFDKEMAEEFFERGRNYVILERYSEAIEDLTKVIEFYPHDEFHSEKLFMAYYARGISYKKLKKYIEAMQDFEMASAFNENSAEARNNLYICEQILFGYDDFVRWDAEAQKEFEIVWDEENVKNLEE